YKTLIKSVGLASDVFPLPPFPATATGTVK
ncbi:unnamed protein product, partial [marine sediment metagenome]